MTGANCTSDPTPNNVNGIVSIYVNGTNSIPTEEICVLLVSAEKVTESEYYTLL